MGHLKDSGGDILRREQERVKEIGLLSTGARSKSISPMDLDAIVQDIDAEILLTGHKHLALTAG